MNKLSAYLKTAAMTALAAVAIGMGLQSCDSAIYDGEGDCSVSYRMKFVYDKNMKWADAFPSEVKSVRLYAFDPQGKLVWQKTESGSRLAADGYVMDLDLPAGQYRFVAWAGLDNEGASERHFTLAGGRADASGLSLTDLTCSLNRSSVDGVATSDKRLDALFHGMADIELPDMTTTGGSHLCTMPLTKNTNHVRVILQQISGEPLDVNDFSFRIEEENGLMGHDNSLLSDETITYRPHNTSNGSAGLGIDDYPEQGKGDAVTDDGSATTQVNVAIADMTVARLVEGRRAYLTIHRRNGNSLVARIPLVDYALMLKDGYGRDMTDQDYLDRQDEYALTFFLDRSQKWIGTSIIINSWKVVLNKVDFGDQTSRSNED